MRFFLLISAAWWLIQMAVPCITSAQTPPLMPTVVPNLLVPGETAQVTVHVGSDAEPVSDLFGIGVELVFNAQALSMTAGLPGSFMDDGSLLLDFGNQVSTTPGLCLYSVTRTPPNPGINGTGAVAVFDVVVPPDATPGFYTLVLARARANDSQGAPVPLDTHLGRFYIGTETVTPISTGNPPPVRFDDQALEVDFHDLETPLNLSVRLFDGAEADNLPDDLAAARHAIWTIEPTELAGMFSADVCLPLDQTTSPPEVLHVLKRSTPDHPWVRLTSELRPNAEQPTQICALGVTSFSQFTLAASNGALPVELVAFDALRDGASVVLRWETASETRNAGFAIQYRRVPEEDWEQAAFVDGQGTTTLPHTYRYHLDGLLPGTYAFRLRQVDFDNSIHYSSVVNLSLEQPGLYELHSAYPNPFANRTTIRYTMPTNAPVSLMVYDALGQAVARLVDGTVAAGSHTVAFDAADLPSGMYIYRLHTPQGALSRKLLLVR